MKTIHIFNEDVKITFNVLVQITYEELVGEPFDGEQLNQTKNLVALYMAVILANNPDTKITWDDLVTKATMEDLNTIRDAVFAALNEWSRLPKVMEDKTEEKGGEEPKNA